MTPLSSHLNAPQTLYHVVGSDPDVCAGRVIVYTSITHDETSVRRSLKALQARPGGGEFWIERALWTRIP